MGNPHATSIAAMVGAGKAVTSETFAGVCEVKHRLMQAFLAATHELVTLQKQQTTALIAGDPEFARFEALIHAAGERKDAVKYQLISHMQTHGC